MNVSVTKRGDVFDMLQNIDKGSVVHVLEDASRECVRESMQTGKKAKITLTIEFDPDMKTDAMRVSGKVTVKLPEPPKKASLFFPTPDGNLSRADVRQPRMFPGEDD